MDIRQHATINCMHRFTCHYVISGLGPTRPLRLLAFVQLCPMGVTPLSALHHIYSFVVKTLRNALHFNVLVAYNMCVSAC